MTELELLEDTIKYYSENTERRCSSDDGCYYSPITIGKEDVSKGCAIGRHLDKDFALEIDKDYDELNIKSLMKSKFIGNEDKFPDWMIKMKLDFLVSLQDLHDNNLYWDEKGLTQEGFEYVKEIKNKLAKNLY